jgi:hypothetical protein
MMVSAGVSGSGSTSGGGLASFNALPAAARAPAAMSVSCAGSAAGAVAARRDFRRRPSAEDSPPAQAPRSTSRARLERRGSSAEPDLSNAAASAGFGAPQPMAVPRRDGGAAGARPRHTGRTTGFGAAARRAGPRQPQYGWRGRRTSGLWFDRFRVGYRRWRHGRSRPDGSRGTGAAGGEAGATPQPRPRARRVGPADDRATAKPCWRPQQYRRDRKTPAATHLGRDLRGVSV